MTADGAPPDAPARGLLRKVPARVWVVVLVVAMALGGALKSSRSRHVGGDFLRYHRAGRLVATGNADRIYDVEWLRAGRVYAEERAEELARRGDRADPYREEEFKYLPATAVLLAPFGALHPRTGWIVWGAWNGALLGATFAAAGAFAARGGTWRWTLVAVGVVGHAAWSNLNLGQLNPSAIAPATVALWALDRRRDVVAGAATAFGTVVKFLPGLLLVFFLVKRRFVAAGVLLAAFLALAVGLPAAALGPSRFAQLSEQHLDQRAHVYTEAAPKDLPGHSVKSFVYRVFGGTRYQTGSGAKRIDWDVSLAQCAPESLRRVVLAINVLLLVGACAVAWGPLRADGDPRGPLEAGIFVCAMLLVSPEARSPHFLYLALPVAAVTYALVRAWRERRAGRGAVLALAGAGAVLVNTSSESLFGRTLANGLAAGCALGWGTLAWGVAALLLLPPRASANR